jgi:SPRY domain
VHVGAYAIDDDPSTFRLVIASIVDRESFKKQYLQLDSSNRDLLTTRLDYYQVKSHVSRHYRADCSLTVIDTSIDITVTKTAGNNTWHGLIWDGSIHKYTITLKSSQSIHMLVGFAPSKTFDVSKTNCDSCGWYLYSSNGTLFSQNGDRHKAYTSSCRCEVGDTITCIYNASACEISFEKNGVSLGVAFTYVNGEDIAPAVELYEVGDSITLSID